MEFIYLALLLLAIAVIYLLVKDYIPGIDRKKKIREHKSRIRYLKVFYLDREVRAEINQKCLAIFNLAQQNGNLRNMKFAISNTYDYEFKKNAKVIYEEMEKKRKAMFADSPISRMVKERTSDS